MVRALKASGGQGGIDIRVAAGIIILAGLLIAAHVYFDLETSLKQILARIQGLGAWAPIGFAGVYILSAVFFVPGSILTLAAGVLFGVFWGTVAASIAATLGAAAAFLVGRHLARGWVERRIAGKERFGAVYKAVAREGWKIVLLTRLSPVFPYNLLNYAFGLSGVSFWGYTLASWIGMIPGALMYVYIGSLAGSLAMVGAGERENSPFEWALYGLGFVATVLLTVYITRVARNALNKKL